MLPDTTLLEKKLEKFPFSRLLFITIRDPKQSGRWMTVGRVHDWAKRYSSTYYIVKSPMNGTHFHLIMGVDKGKTPRPSKGIHFDIKQLGKTGSIKLPDATEQEDMRKAKHFADQKRLRFNLKHSVPPQCTHIANIIKKYWIQQKQKAKRATAKCKKQYEITKVIDYLEKNLLENTFEYDDPDPYVHYIMK